MRNREARPLYVLAGPTAAGKTTFAHAVARETGWPICSADAMLVYRGMDIGTAKPTTVERKGLVYGGIDIVDPTSTFSVGDYLEHAQAFMASLPSTQPVLVVGGTGLYIKALLRGLDPMPAVDPALREEIDACYRAQGLAGIQQALKEADPERYAQLADPNNPRRVTRALELARMKVPLKKVWEEDTSSPTNQVVVLEWDRTVLYQRIEQRVDMMLREGLIKEVEHLMATYPVWSTTASRAIGYQEARAVIEGQMTVPQAREEIIRRTKQYARRQATWFRHQVPHHTLALEGEPDPSGVAERLQNLWIETESGVAHG